MAATFVTAFSFSSIHPVLALDDGIQLQLKIMQQQKVEVQREASQVDFRQLPVLSESLMLTGHLLLEQRRGIDVERNTLS
jgi:hypothetical protein